MLAVLPLLGGCTASPPRSPLPVVRAESPAEVVEVLAGRVKVARLAAALRMTYDGPAVSGTFDAVALYQAPRHLRFTASKDLVLATHDIFDLALGPARYALEYDPEDAGEPRRFEGAAEALPRDHPRFAGFHWAGEALFLPGGGEGAHVVADEGDEVVVAATLASGAAVRWTARRPTLEVTRADVDAPGGRRLRIHYGDYRRHGARFIPGAVRFEDPGDGVRIEVVVRQLELDPPLEPADLELPASGREAGR